LDRVIVVILRRFDAAELTPPDANAADNGGCGPRNQNFRFITPTVSPANGQRLRIQQANGTLNRRWTDVHVSLSRRQVAATRQFLGGPRSRSLHGEMGAEPSTVASDNRGPHQESPRPTLRRSSTVVNRNRRRPTEEFADQQFGVPTIKDILGELEKRGRDPRPEFKTATFKEGVERLDDLQPGMLLEGVVTNVANFGAFVDVGVHQDGLVHVSALADRFVNDPRDVVKAGDIVRVKVLAVDLKRRRIGLTMKLQDPAPGRATSDGNDAPRERGSRQPVRPSTPASPPAAPSTAFGAAFAKAVDPRSRK
jgi:predicted RNA-binding protein with RPS1 domain